MLYIQNETVCFEIVACVVDKIYLISEMEIKKEIIN
jgi:hypothetical protein